MLKSIECSDSKGIRLLKACVISIREIGNVKKDNKV